MPDFNIRVYGLCLNARYEILVTDEYRFGMKMTKFPGGGLEEGEGTRDCLKRECLEELEQDVEVKEHFYTTDYYQRSILDKRQVISIYYFFQLQNEAALKISKTPFDFEMEEDAQSFRWIPLSSLNEEEFTFPIDQIVVGMLKEKYSPF